MLGQSRVRTPIDKDLFINDNRRGCHCGVGAVAEVVDVRGYRVAVIDHRTLRHSGNLDSYCEVGVVQSRLVNTVEGHVHILSVIDIESEVITIGEVDRSGVRSVLKRGAIVHKNDDILDLGVLDIDIIIVSLGVHASRVDTNLVVAH